MPLSSFGSFLLDLLDPPDLVYQVEFTTGVPQPSVNTLSIVSPVTCAATEVPGQNHFPPSGPVSGLTDGLVLAISRPADTAESDKPAAMCGIGAPKDLKRFRLRASGEFGSGSNAFDPAGTDDQWAAMVLAHNGGVKLVDFAPAGSTHQVRDAGKIALGAAGAQNVVPMALPIDADVAYPRSSGRVFTIETDIDCYRGTGVCRLRTPGFTWPRRTWSHVYGIPDPGAPSRISGLGVGIAIAKGTGRATVTFRRFEIWQWDRPAPWWQRLIVAVLRP